jgi:transposase
MATRQFHLTEEQVKELRRAYTNCKDGPTRTRYQAVRLYGTGYPVKEVMDITGCSRTSLMDWCRIYRTEGSAGLIDHRTGGNRDRFTEQQIDELATRLRTYTPADLFGGMAATANGQFWTVEDLQRIVQQQYNVQYKTRGSYHRLFARCGFSYQRPAKVYKSRSEAKIAEFEEQLEKNSSTSSKKRRIPCS